MTKVRFHGDFTRIALLSAVADDIHLPPPRNITRQSQAKGGVKQYVGGVRRGVTLPGKAETVTVDLPRPSWEHSTTLGNWVGRAILYRDILGNLFYGILRSANEVRDPKTPSDLQQADRFRIVIETTTDTPETLL